MSGIGCVGGSQSSDYLRRLAQTRGAGSSNESKRAQQAEATLSQAVSDAGGKVDLKDLRDQIQSAVQDVLKNVSSTDDPKEVRKKLDAAVDKTLQDNGIDVDKLKKELESATAGAGAGTYGPPPPFGGHGGAQGRPPSGGPPPGGPPPGGHHGGPHGAKNDSSTDDSSTTDPFSLINALDDNEDSDSSTTNSSTSSTSSTTATSTDGRTTLSFEGQLNNWLAKIFESFPSGSGFDAAA